VKPRVFIHTNHRQLVGARVAQYALRRASARPDAFDVEILHTADVPFLREREGQRYLRDGAKRPWLGDDLQSFTPLRFLPPERMGFRGRALVTDPDVFAVGDVMELLERDLHGRALACRQRSGSKGRAGFFASSVMLLDCEQLTHWRCADQFARLFSFELDYSDWIGLRLEPPGSIAPLEEHWNDFDRLTPETRMLHNTRRWTQPWKTGLPIDFHPAETTRAFPPLGWVRRARRALLGPYTGLGRYRRHPDPAQERFFFTLVRECLDSGVFSATWLRDEMRRGHLRPDAFDVLERTARAAA
jgi:hypothetical protein